MKRTLCAALSILLTMSISVTGCSLFTNGETADNYESGVFIEESDGSSEYSESSGNNDPSVNSDPSGNNEPSVNSDPSGNNEPSVNSDSSGNNEPSVNSDPSGNNEPSADMKGNSPEGVNADNAHGIPPDISSISAESLLINNANSFYYYEQLGPNDRELYDAMYDAVKYPDQVYSTACTIYIPPSSDEFRNTFNFVYEAMLFDHPELFWLSNSRTLHLMVSYTEPENADSYPIKIYLSEPYPEYAQEMTAFNDAVSSFLADIDLTLDDHNISWQIHDKLIDTVTYASYAAELSPDVPDLAHTAYGALVSDSQGNANSAVCDGYAMAFVYLMQQAGCQAIRITGLAGDSDETAESHSWNLACLGGRWYEIDPTWDDPDETLGQIGPEDPGYSVIEAAFGDQEFYVRLTHYMYGLDTAVIRYYYDDGSYTYSNGEYYIDFVNDSVHIRDSEPGGREENRRLMELAPIAE